MNFKRAIKALDAEDADSTLASFLVNEASSYMAGRGYAELVREHVPQAELDHTAVKKYLAACIAVLTPAATGETPQSDTLLTLAEAAEILGYKPSGLRKLVKRGDIRYVQVGRGPIKFRREWLDQFSAGNVVNQPSMPQRSSAATTKPPCTFTPQHLKRSS